MRASITDLRARGDRAWIALVGLVGRFTGGRFGSAQRWQVVGAAAAGYGEDRFEADVFGVPHIYVRPAGAAAVEAIVAHVGASPNHPVVVAARATASPPTLEEGELAVVISGATIKITKDGDVVVTAKAGRTVSVDDGSGAVALATKADLEGLAEVFRTWSLTPIAEGALAGLIQTLMGTPPAPATWPAGTSVIKGK